MKLHVSNIWVYLVSSTCWFIEWLAVAEHYRGLLGGFVLDQVDKELERELENEEQEIFSWLDHQKKMNPWVLSRYIAK